MKSKFCIKLAISNLKRNYRTYIPFLIASTTNIFTYLVYNAISTSSTIGNLPIQSNFIQTFFLIGKVIIGIFSMFFLLYANGFLMKQRMKEIGLYSILGLEKKHISNILFFEILIITVFSLLFAIILSLVFGNAFFLIFVRIMNISGINSFSISGKAILNTVLLFGIIYIFIYMITIIKVYKTNTINLLKSEEVGEKEPKNHRIFSIIGFILLIIGYTYSLSASMVTDFILAAPIIVIATYILFITGSITILKHLKNNKKLFYKPKYFISISNLMYRMKKNGAGLASICIFSTAIIFLISITSSIYFGKSNMLKNRFPFDISIILGERSDVLLQKIDTISKTTNVKITQRYSYDKINFTGYLFENKLGTSSTIQKNDLHKLNYDVNVISLDDYNSITNENRILHENEILLYDLYGKYSYDTLVLSNGNDSHEYIVKEELRDFPLQKRNTNNKMRTMYIITTNTDIVNDYMDNVEKNSQLALCLKGTEANRIMFAQNIQQLVKNNSNILTCNSRDIESQKWYNYFGGGLFLCIFLGALFLISLVLIIYFKQLSEGYEDRKRFLVLEKVGMDKQAIKATINEQIKLMFFLPIIVAVVHMLISYNLICRVLAGFYLTDTSLILCCILVIILLFTVVYTIVYFITAKVYYKLVQK